MAMTESDYMLVSNKTLLVVMLDMSGRLHECRGLTQAQRIKINRLLSAAMDRAFAEIEKRRNKKNT